VLFLVAVAGGCGAVTLERMQGMDAGPGTDLGELGWYVGIWVTMMAAMMLPSVAPMALIYTRVARIRAERGRAYVPTWIFLSGYFVAWTLYGLLAYGIYRAITLVDPGFLAWDAQGPIVAGIAIARAGVFQLTSLKEVCLRHCRTPLHFALHGWRARGGQEPSGWGPSTASTASAAAGR
jgi:predicted metal-binding membrane protein